MSHTTLVSCGEPAQHLDDPPWIVVDAACVPAQIAQPGMLLVDAHAADRYRVENETPDPVGGHIPGARNRFSRDNLGGNGQFKSAAALRGEFDALPAGHKVHAGSWSEWSADPARAVKTGPLP